MRLGSAWRSACPGLLVLLFSALPSHAQEIPLEMIPPLSREGVIPPDRVLYGALLRNEAVFERQAQANQAKGLNGAPYRNHFTRQFGLTSEEQTQVARIATTYYDQWLALKAQARKLAHEFRSYNFPERVYERDTPLPPRFPPLADLAKVMEAVTLQARDEMRTALGGDRFRRLDSLLRARAAHDYHAVDKLRAGMQATPSASTVEYRPDGGVYGYTSMSYDPATNIGLAYSETEIDLNMLPYYRPASTILIFAYVKPVCDSVGDQETFAATRCSFSAQPPFAYGYTAMSDHIAHAIIPVNPPLCEPDPDGAPCPPIPAPEYLDPENLSYYAPLTLCDLYGNQYFGPGPVTYTTDADIVVGQTFDTADMLPVHLP